MKNIRENGSQAALCLQEDAFGIPGGREIFTVSTPEHPTRKTPIPGVSENLQLKRLNLENQRLKELVENLTIDKLSQARRITELCAEQSRLKKVLADLILGNGNGK